MKDAVTRSMRRYTQVFAAFTPGQKVIALLGTGALVLAAVLVFKWVAQPQYAPLYTNLSASDASAVVDKLDSSGVSYKLTNDGSTISVPKDQVYKTRITLSGQGLPTANEGGYSLLDTHSLSTSQFQEQTDFKRAMEGELTKTIEAMDGVNTAVVHLALPQKQVFADKQDPPTASVLVQTKPGVTLGPEQVQAIVHLVAASIDGMDASGVTVADSTGRLLSTTDTAGGELASSQDQYTQDFQQQMQTRLQAMLDRVLGPGNSAVQVTANLNFDKTVVEDRTFKRADPKGLASSQTTNTETYKGPGAASAAGTVGANGQMGTTTTGGSQQSTYDKKSETTDQALDSEIKRIEQAPGAINSLHVSAVLDQTAAANNNPAEITRMLQSAAGFTPKRGDTLNVSTLPFDRSSEKAAAQELKANNAAAAKSARMDTFRTIAIGGGLLFALLIAWLRGRKKNKARREATNYVIEHLQQDRALTAQQQRELENPASTLLGLEAGPQSPEDEIRQELVELVESQPEDVANLLRGWLVDR